MKNLIAFKNRILLPSEEPSTGNFAMAVQVNAELMQFGFMLSEDALKALSTYSFMGLTSYFSEILDYLKEITGGSKLYRPFWKGFPEEVMDKSEMELWLHMIVNYISNGTYEPADWMKKRKPAFEHSTYTVINLGTEEDFDKIFTDLVSVNQSLTPEDLETVRWFALNRQKLVFPKEIPFKENLATLASFRLNVPVKSVRDVLRLAVGMSGGDVSLPKVPSNLYKPNRWYSLVGNPERAKFQFRKFKREERKYILSLLEKTNCSIEDASTDSERWKRLGEILHPFEYLRKFPKSFNFFHSLRNQRVRSFHSKVDSAFSSSVEEGLSKLAERPGEFVRRLDSLLRKYGSNTVLKYFYSISSKVSNKVLFETLTHFLNRDVSAERFIFRKGSRKRFKLPTLKPLDSALVADVVATIKQSFEDKFKTLPTLGKVFLDEELRNIPLPSNMRTLNPALKPVVRGSKLKWENPEASTIRAFLHFSKNATGCTIDLSAVLVGSASSVVLDWSHQKPLKTGAYHSGDSWARIGNCAEYVDLDIYSLVSQGFKYVLIQLNNYSRTSSLVENNYFGIMERENSEANELWLPKTISNCFNIKVPSKVTCAIIDLVDRSFVLVDEDVDSSASVNNASVKDLENIGSYMRPPVFSVYDLLKIHVDKRGVLVDNKDKADTVLSFDQFSSSYVETLKYMGV